MSSRWIADPPPGPREQYQFTPDRHPGPAGAETTAVGVFERFINLNLAKMICNASIKYSESERYKARRTRKGAESAKMTVNEFYRWCAITILISVHGKTHIAHNWSTHPLLVTPGFGQNMSHDRYVYLSSILHTCADDQPKENDTL